MINLEKKTSQPVEAEMHYKMYKDGKKLVTAGITTLMFSGFVLGTQTTAHADTTSDTSFDGGQSQATTGGNAVTQTTAASAASATTATAQTSATTTQTASVAASATATASQAGTITQPINVDSSALDQAVEAAKQAGLNVTQKPTTSSTVAPSGVDSARAQIESDYASQAAKLNEATEQQETANKYNDSKGDTTTLDEAVKKAQSTPGMSVTQDETKTTTKNADDKSGIANWEKSTASDYASQVDAINKAIDAQNQNNAKYEQEMAEWKAAHLNNNPNGLTTADVQQQLSLAAEPDAKVDIKILDSRASLGPSDRVFKDTTWSRVNLSTDISGDIAQATYTNLKNSYYVDKNGQKHLIAKIVKVFSNSGYTVSNNDGHTSLLDIATDPSLGVWYEDISGITETDTFYDADGNVINLSDNTAYIAVTSLNSLYESSKNGWTNKEYALSGLPAHVESATPISNGKAYTLAGSSVTVHSNGALYADQTNDRVDTSASDAPQNTDQTTWKSTDYWDANNSENTYFGAGIIAVHGDSFSIRFETNFGDNDAKLDPWVWYTLDTIIPQTPTPTRQTTSTSYHYNVLKVKPNWSPDDLSYQYHNLNVTTTPDKNWTQGDQVVTGKTEIAGDAATATINMDYAKPSDSKESMSKLAVTDNYSQMAKYVTYQGAQVYENDQLVTDQYNIVNDAKTGTVTATRKDASKAPGGSIKLVVDFKINENTPSGTKLINGGSATINNDTATTPEVPVNTYDQTANKHWIEGSQVVDGKTYINDDVITTKVDMSLPDPSTLAHSLTNVTVDDNYTDFANKAKLQSYRVEENGKNVTDQYTVTNKDGHLTAVRKNASTAPAGTVSLIATWLINSDVASGTTFTNAGSGRINNHTVDTNTPIVKTYEQTANKHWVEGDQTVDNKTYVDGDEAHGRVTMSLPDPSTLAKKLSDVTLVDDYTDFMDKVTYESAQVFENGKDMTAEYIITNVNGKVTAMRKDPSTTPAGNAQLLVNFKINDDVKSGTVLTNKGSGRINNKTVSTNEAKITVYTQDADKHWTEGSQVVDGEVFVDGAITHATVTTTLPDQSTLAKPLTDITITDDYSQFADKVDLQDVHVLENDKDVTDQYTITKQDGKVVATRKDASKAPAGKAQLVLTFKLHADVESGTKLINKGSSMINKHTVSTNDATITTFKPNPKKDIVVSVDSTKSLNGFNIDLNSTFDYKLEGATLPKNSNALSEYGFHDDYDQTHDQYNGGYVVLLNNDVTLTDGTVLKKGTDVTKNTTQTIDQENGKVDIEFDSDFLAKVDRTKSEFGATAYLAMTRIKAEDVENKYTNTINGTEFTSNTVTSHTDEPKPNTPETPSTPKTETPTTPQSTTPETPIKTSQQPVFAAVQPAAVAAERQATPQQALPQTGNDKDEALALTGLASLLFGLGTLGLKKRRRRA